MVKMIRLAQFVPLWLRARWGRMVFPWTERGRLLRRLPSGSIGAEIGVWKGDFSARLLSAVRPSKLHLIDPWAFQDEYPDRLYGGLDAKSQLEMDEIYRDVQKRFRQHANVSIHRQNSVETASGFDDNYFDWVYIDGNHSYEFVKMDMETYLPKVKPGGLVTGDDYLWGPESQYPVQRAVDELVRSGRVFMVWSGKRQFVLQKT